MRNLWRLSAGILIIVASVFGYFAWRASTDLVTLNVRNMDVHKAIGKIEWQTWEKIFVGKEVAGKVTLNVRKVPLEDVLEIISEQTESRWNKLYPLYSSGKSLNNLKKVLVGEISAADNGWKALRGGFRFRGGGPSGIFGSMNETQNKSVTLNISMKDIEVATAALSRYSRAQVVPEDGTRDLVSLKLSNAPVVEGVKQLAKQVRRRWTTLYALESFRRERGPRPDRPPEQFAGDNQGTNRGEFDFEARREFFRTNENIQQRIEAQLETMTPEERAQWEQRRKEFEAMRNMTPEQRREAFQKMASTPGFQQRMQSRMMNAIKNSTPEQRVERDIRRNQRSSRSGGR